MTEEQEKALVMWVAETTRLVSTLTGARWDLNERAMESAAGRLCEEFGFTHTDINTGNPVKPEPGQ